VLVNLAKNPISSYFSGIECIYRKELVHRYHCIITLGDKLVTLLIAIFAMSKVTPYCLLLQIRPVTESRHSTGTDPADIQVAVTLGNLQPYFLKQKVDWQNISLLNSVQRRVKTNILSICSSVLRSRRALSLS